MNTFSKNIILVLILFFNLVFTIKIVGQHYNQFISYTDIQAKATKHIDTSDLSKSSKRVLKQLFLHANSIDLKERIQLSKDTVKITMVYNTKTNAFTLDENYKTSRYINGVDIRSLYDSLMKKDMEKSDAQDDCYSILDILETESNDSLRDVLNNYEEKLIKKESEYFKLSSSINYNISEHNKKMNNWYESEYYFKERKKNSIEIIHPVFVRPVGKTSTPQYKKIKNKVKSHFYIIEIILNPSSSFYRVLIPKKTDAYIRTYAPISSLF